MPALRAETACAKVPILLAASPFVAMRSAPTTTASTIPDAMREHADESGITVTGIPALESSQAVSRAP